MSATPRSWRAGRNYTGDAGGDVSRIDGPDGAQIAEIYGEGNRDLIVRAVNAFDALLAVAKAAHADHTFQADSKRSPLAELDVALRRLDAQHPDWRDW